MQYQPPRKLRVATGRILRSAAGPFVLLGALIAVERPTPDVERLRFEGYAAEVGVALADRVNDRARALGLLAPLFGGGDEPNWREFSELPRYGLPARGEHELFAWIPRVRAPRRLSYEQSTGRNALRSFQIREADSQGAVGASMKAIPKDSALMRAHHLFSSPPPGGVDKGALTGDLDKGVILSTHDYGGAWQGNLAKPDDEGSRDRIRRAIEFGLNVTAFAAQRKRRAELAKI